MNSTIFNGLHKNGYHVDIIFLSYSDICDNFQQRYSSYFNNVHYIKIKKTKINFFKNEKLKVLNSFLVHFIKDRLWRPYKKADLKELAVSDYDLILSFCPPAISGLLARDVIKINKLENIPHYQYWTDPLSLGLCNEVKDMPKKRYFHYILEKNILKDADKIIYCYPLLCEMQKQLYPQFAHKMKWADVPYIERNVSTFEKKKGKTQVKIGFFGAYPRRVRNILPLLNAMQSFPDVLFIVRGDTDVSIDKTQYQNLDIEFGRKPNDEIQQLEDECDILLSSGSIAGINHPAGKTFYYANVNKPIVYIGDGYHKDYFANYLKEFDRYIICDNNEDSIKSAINQAIKSLSTFRLSMSERLHPEVVARKIVSF